MDKYEYQVRSEEIKDLIRKKDYAQAAEIADTIDWRKVKSVVMLCTVSDLYKMNRRYENAKDLLLLAYDRRPGARSIVYSLCELCIKTGDLVQAMEYYKEFANIAPRDPGRYILQYKIYEDQDVSLEERIAVLEELKRHDYIEKWAYELAYLYHRVGLETRCVEECDELILWFGDGEYVIKAMELKRLHQPLTPEQQKIYDSRFDPKPEENEEASEEEEAFDEEDKEETQETGGDTTIWAREAVSTRAAWGDTVIYDPVHAEEISDVQKQDYNTVNLGEQDQEETSYEEPEIETVAEEEVEVPEVSWQEESPEEPEIFVKTMDMSPFNTINLQAELAQELKQLLEQEKDVADEAPAAKTQEFNVGDIESQLSKGNRVATTKGAEPEAGEPRLEEFGLGEPGEAGLDGFQEEFEMVDLRVDEPDSEDFAGEELEMEEAESIELQEPDREEAKGQEPESEESNRSELDILDLDEEMPYARLSDEVEDSEVFFGETGEINLGKSVSVAGGLEKKMAGIEPPKAMASVLSQESDGQLRIVLPQNNIVEKQITGQMDIEDVLAEWERMKQANAEKRKEEVRQHVLQQTGNMFTEFEAAVRDGLLEKLEKEEGATVMPEQEIEESGAEELDIEELSIEELGAEDSNGFVPLDAELLDVETQDSEILESTFPELDTVNREDDPETLDGLAAELEKRNEAVKAEDYTELEGFEELEEIFDPAEAEEAEVEHVTIEETEAKPAETKEPELAEEAVETEEPELAEEAVETEEPELAEEAVETEEPELV
ncbi:MAG: hypothetical protein IJ794_02710, partial [Lachnospiraceae bacterium]|nr:hypothetical protein [Lachnospiraceae bacterium]